MSQKYPVKKRDSVYDGFMNRPYDPSCDGWRNEMPDSSDYPAVQFAQQIIDMFHEIKTLRAENWELKKNLASEEKINSFGFKRETVVEVSNCENCYNYHRKGYDGVCDAENESFYTIREAEMKLGKPVVEVA